MLFKIKLVYNFSTDASPSPTFFNLALYSNDSKTTLVFGMGRHFQLGATPLYRLPCPVNPRLIQTWLQEKCAKKPHWPISITQHTLTHSSYKKTGGGSSPSSLCCCIGIYYIDLWQSQWRV